MLEILKTIICLLKLSNPLSNKANCGNRESLRIEKGVVKVYGNEFLFLHPSLLL